MIKDKFCHEKYILCITEFNIYWKILLVLPQELKANLYTQWWSSPKSQIHFLISYFWLTFWKKKHILSTQITEIVHLMPPFPFSTNAFKFYFLTLLIAQSNNISPINSSKTLDIDDIPKSAVKNNTVVCILHGLPASQNIVKLFPLRSFNSNRSQRKVQS